MDKKIVNKIIKDLTFKITEIIKLYLDSYSYDEVILNDLINARLKISFTTKNYSYHIEECGEYKTND